MHFTIQLGGKENRSLYRGLRYVEVRFIEVPLYVTSVEYKSTMQSVKRELTVTHKTRVFSTLFISYKMHLLDSSFI